MRGGGGTWGGGPRAGEERRCEGKKVRERRDGQRGSTREREDVWRSRDGVRAEDLRGRRDRGRGPRAGEGVLGKRDGPRGADVRGRRDGAGEMRRRPRMRTCGGGETARGR